MKGFGSFYKVDNKDRMRTNHRFVLSQDQLASNRDTKYPHIFDSHFHIENYTHDGMSVSGLLNMMDRVGVSKSVLFGLPLRQIVVNKDDEGGNYYTDSDLSLYYYSATDFSIAEQYRLLSSED